MRPTRAMIETVPVRTIGTHRAGVLSLGAGAASVAVIVGVTFALHIIWLWRFRHGYLTEADESGYMQFALSNFDGLHDHGLISYAKTVGGRGTFGPLLPAVTALAYPVLGRGIFGSLLVVPLFFAALVLATYGLARRIVSVPWAVVAALAVAGVPAVTDYTRLFHFAVPATACMTGALWALLKSEGLRKTRWAVGTGVLVALTMLARTMTVGYLPGLAAAAAVQALWGRTERRLRLKNLGLAAVTTVVVAGPWYIRNARSVGDNLLGTGYGEAAVRYGRHHSIVSWSFWTKELRLVANYTWLPLAATLTACFLAALVSAVINRRRRRSGARARYTRRHADIAALGLVMVEGYIVLTSTRNEGTAFALPWLPLLVILAVAAAAGVAIRPARIGLASAVVAASLLGLAAKSGWFGPLASVRTAAVPGFGSITVTDGRGVIQEMVATAGYDIGSPTRPLPSIHRRWLPVERAVVAWSIRQTEDHREPTRIILGLDDTLFGNSRLILAAQLWFHRFLPVDYVRSGLGGDTVASYRDQLTAHPENVLITGQELPNATVTESKVVAAGRSLGFVRLKRFALPDGRTIWLWWRTTAGR
jgi:hypothetical protein